MPSQCLAQPMAMPLAVVRSWGDQAVSIMGQTSRSCMVCLMPQSIASCLLENPNFNMFTLDRPTCVCTVMEAELPSWACEIYWVLINQSGYPHHHRVAPLNGPNSASGAIFQTTKYTVYANATTTQSSLWCHQALISGPCNQHFSDSPENVLGFTPKACFLCRKIEDQSNSLNSVRFCNISVRHGDHAPFLETQGNSVTLGRSVEVISGDAIFAGNLKEVPK